MDIPTPLLFVIALLALLVIIHSLVLIGLVRMVSQLYRTVLPEADPSGGPAGQALPAFVAQSLSGNIVDSAAFKGRLTALLFVSPSCASCMTTLDELEFIRAKAAGHVVVVCEGELDECSAIWKRFEPIELLHDDDRRIRKMLGVTRWPTAVLVGADGRIKSFGEPVRGELESLVNESRREASDDVGPADYASGEV